MIKHAKAKVVTKKQQQTLRVLCTGIIINDMIKGNYIAHLSSCFCDSFFASVLFSTAAVCLEVDDFTPSFNLALAAFALRMSMGFEAWSIFDTQGAFSFVTAVAF